MLTQFANSKGGWEKEEWGRGGVGGVNRKDRVNIVSKNDQCSMCRDKQYAK